MFLGCHAGSVLEHTNTPTGMVFVVILLATSGLHSTKLGTEIYFIFNRFNLWYRKYVLVINLLSIGLTNSDLITAVYCIQQQRKNLLIFGKINDFTGDM